MELRVKKTKRYRKQKSEKIAEYLDAIKGISFDKIAYVDETGIDTCLYCEYGWSQCGEPFIGTVSDLKFRRTGIVAT